MLFILVTSAGPLGKCLLNSFKLVKVLFSSLPLSKQSEFDDELVGGDWDLQKEKEIVQ